MAQRRVGSRGSTRVEGPHREGNGVLREGVVARAAVRLRVQETLALLWILLESVPLRLPLRPCGPQKQSGKYRALQGFHFLQHLSYQIQKKSLKKIRDVTRSHPKQAASHYY